MGARADATARTREAILVATWELAQERLKVAISLADVAGRAGVTVRTVLRHFGSREALFEAAREHGMADIAQERHAPAGDLAEAIRVLIEHYERRGDFVLRMLDQETLDAELARDAAIGRRLHRQWVRDVFGPQLAAASDRRELEDLLVVATDVYAWKLLRRDAGLSRSKTQERMHTMVRRLVDRRD
jgi:AcrR family transcriptional regulator